MLKNYHELPAPPPPEEPPLLLEDDDDELDELDEELEEEDPPPDEVRILGISYLTCSSCLQNLQVLYSQPQPAAAVVALCLTFLLENTNV